MRLVVLLLSILAIQACATKGHEDVRFGTSLKQEQLVTIEWPGLGKKPELNCDKSALQKVLAEWSETLRLYKPHYHTSPYRPAGKMLLTFESGNQFDFAVFATSLHSESLLFLIGPDGKLNGLEGNSEGEVFVGAPILLKNICSR